MTHKIYHSLIAALIGAATTGAVQAAPIPAMGLRFVAAEASDSSISVRSARVLPHERSMIVSMCIRVDRDLKGTESIELRPVLTDSTGHSAVLPSIFINGRTQHIAFQRDRRNAKRDLVTLRRRNGMEQTVDYLRDCPECQGTLSVKIEHRYNMLHADAAPSRVEKADVFIRNTVTGETQHKAFDKAMLDASGYYADMEFSGAGTYDCLVWSGIDNKIFDWDTQTVSLATQPGDTIAHRLPLIFHGRADATNVELRSDNLTTVDMMQDTKFVNVTFNYNGSRHVQDTDFLLTLSAPNSVLDASNNTAADHATTYKPYGARTESIDHQQVVNYALSTLRLMEKDRDQCRLRLDYRPADGSQGQNLFDIPIIDYLLMCKDFEGENMKTQEYLDRQSTYHIVFLIRDTGNPHAPFAVSVLSVNNWQMRDDQPVVKTN